MNPVPVDNKTLDWPRKVANAVNYLLSVITMRTTHPFQELSAAPADPEDGQTYYDTTLAKVRTWASGAWNNHW